MKTYLYNLVLILILTSVIKAQDFIRVDSPKTSDRVVSKRTINLVYTIIGFNTVNPPLTKYYPTSMSVDFVWKEQNSTSSAISLQVAASLDIVPYPDGTRSIERRDRWRVPNCHFFSRYPPTHFDFSLLFTPVYSTAAGSENITGVTQNPINVPLSIVVDNSTFPKC